MESNIKNEGLNKIQNIINTQNIVKEIIAYIYDDVEILKKEILGEVKEDSGDKEGCVVVGNIANIQYNASQIESTIKCIRESISCITHEMKS